MHLNRQHQARAGHFRLGINDFAFDRATDYLKKHGWSGKVSIAVDDTKLHPDMRPMWDAHLEQHVLVGGIGDPIPIADPEIFDDILSDPSYPLANKVRYTSLV
jgi:hypothetical protein